MTPDELLGTWHFTRMVDDRRDDRRIPVHGTATFSRSGPDRIVWVESGTMGLPGGEVPISTERVLERGPEGSWAANFADGRGFHDWHWGVELVHDCAPDVYAGWLEGDARGWRMSWAASGPSKDYVIETAYRRL